MPRRSFLRVGGLAVGGLTLSRLLRAESAAGVNHSNKSVIMIYLPGGPPHQDMFDLKTEAPSEIRGEFKPISTRTPGLQICEHLPMLAQRSDQWSLCRSLTHGSNEHSAGHHMILTGHSQLPPGFKPNEPSRTDRPSIAAIAGRATASANNLPPAVVLPERLVHNSGRVIPGQDAGEMGPQHDPWMIGASPFHAKSYGAFPTHAFDHQKRGNPDKRIFQAPQAEISRTLVDACPRLPR